MKVYVLQEVNDIDGLVTMGVFTSYEKACDFAKSLPEDEYDDAEVLEDLSGDEYLVLSANEILVRAGKTKWLDEDTYSYVALYVIQIFDLDEED